MSLQMCRVCLREGSDYIDLGNGKDSYRYKLIICVPEINVDVLKNPALCDDCAVKLAEAYKFKRTCIESEKKINENLTLKINLENALEPNADLQLSSIFLTGEHVNKKKRSLSDDLLISNLNDKNSYYMAIKKENDSEGNDIDDSLNQTLVQKKIRRTSETSLPSNVTDVDIVIKQEQDCDTDKFQAVFEQVHIDICKKFKDTSSMIAQPEETFSLMPNNIIIKEEPNFFYSEYDSDSMENNYVQVSNQETATSNVNTNKANQTFISASEILSEHSYFANFKAKLNVPLDKSNFAAENVIDSNTNCSASIPRSEGQVQDLEAAKFNKVTCNICKELYDVQYMAIHKEVHKTVHTVNESQPEKDGYLSVKVDTERKLMCRYCNKIFDSREPLNDHIQMVHGKDLLTESRNTEIHCRICNLNFDAKCMKRHLELHRTEKIDVNVDSASRIKLICRVCGDTFTDEEVFKSHYDTHKQATVTTTCTVCGETYDKFSAKAHMEFHNIVEEIVLDSDVDETTFFNTSTSSIPSEAKVASTSDSKTISYTCCAEEFSNLYLLHLHTTKAHGYVCYICNIKFLNKQALGGHFRIHNEQKSHQCKDCGKYFAQRGNLLRHTHFVHNCIMPYKCDKCGQRFRRNKYLEEHMRTHTQKYACSECDRVFTELKTLRRHKRFHLPRPHQCDLCDTVFTAKSSLVRHKRDIHKLKIQGRRSYGFGDIVLGAI